jgi:hypothetical protein
VTKTAGVSSSGRFKNGAQYVVVREKLCILQHVSFYSVYERPQPGKKLHPSKYLRIMSGFLTPPETTHGNIENSCNCAVQCEWSVLFLDDSCAL